MGKDTTKDIVEVVTFPFEAAYEVFKEFTTPSKPSEKEEKDKK